MEDIKDHSTEVTFLMPSTDALGALATMTPDFSLILKYKKADDWALLKNQEVRAYYMGIKEIPNTDGELVTCAIFVSSNECFLAGSMVLIEAVRTLDKGTPVAITYRGKSQNKKTEGETMRFDVITLR